jgi:hypothetical protein
MVLHSVANAGQSIAVDSRCVAQNCAVLQQKFVGPQNAPRKSQRSLPSFVFLLWFPSKLPSNIGKHGKLAVPLHGYVLPTPSPTRFVALKLVCGRRFSACSASNIMKTNEFRFYLAITSWARSPRARRYFSQLSRARERTRSRRGLSWLSCGFGVSGQENRSYRVSFEKIRKNLPGFRCAWDARRGAKQLYDLFKRIDMTKDVLEYLTFTRLKQLEYLIRPQQIDRQFF